MDYDNEKVRNITDEMRKHETGSAAEAFYSPEAWRELCDRIDAANEREVDDALNARRPTRHRDADRALRF